jgi:hypothetical protein
MSEPTFAEMRVRSILARETFEVAAFAKDDVQALVDELIRLRSAGDGAAGCEHSDGLYRRLLTERDAFQESAGHWAAEFRAVKASVAPLSEALERAEAEVARLRSAGDGAEDVEPEVRHVVETWKAVRHKYEPNGTLSPTLFVCLDLLAEKVDR